MTECDDIHTHLENVRSLDRCAACCQTEKAWSVRKTRQLTSSSGSLDAPFEQSTSLVRHVAGCGKSRAEVSDRTLLWRGHCPFVRFLQALGEMITGLAPQYARMLQDAQSCITRCGEMNNREGTQQARCGPPCACYESADTLSMLLLQRTASSMVWVCWSYEESSAA